MNENKKTLGELLNASYSAFGYAIGFSCLVNLLMLTAPIYMLQVFDRVLPSQSSDTLVYLTIIAILAIIVYGILDIARAQVLTRVSWWIDNKLSPIALAKSLDHTLLGGSYAAQSLADITTLRQFLSSPSIYAFFDAPWIIIFLIVIFLLSFPLGIIATLGAIVLLSLAILNEKVSRKPLEQANTLHMNNQESISNSIRQAECIQAMGMMSPIVSKWLHNNEAVLAMQCTASDRSGIVLSFSKSIRLILQILILGVGAYYVINGELTSGAMLAASIIMGRALAPAEQAIGAWKQAINALQAYRRLQHYLSQPETRPPEILLPKPQGRIDVNNLLYIPAGAKKPVIQGVQFTLMPGESLGIIGPSGSGKSTLARLLVGIWPPTNGTVRLDGANIYTWNRQDIGNHVGYLPQDTLLFKGSVKENIARMDKIEDAKIISAAQFVGVHDMILHLSHGYDTDTSRYHLSGGQAQRIALARAFYGSPALVVLDEPESNLDQEGLAALELIYKNAKKSGITIIVVSQRPMLMKHCNKVLVMRDGHMERFGLYAEIIR
ncbi:type I secretion system permease/ATPase [Legionella oakridgensis]|uniref:type I secretion system permease/ATPase n=1 Tax=Legionella oakridgensis TaxID=29423 RepID=UPI0003DE1B7D|nr:type I secretion system permease/ATPase [Legionella oakridgensis]ETO92379.1 type I secretion system ABC transporter, PrtD family [Legionella oakridgensis RV-2-2007]